MGHAFCQGEYVGSTKPTVVLFSKRKPPFGSNEENEEMASVL